MLSSIASFFWPLPDEKTITDEVLDKGPQQRLEKHLAIIGEMMERPPAPISSSAIDGGVVSVETDVPGKPLLLIPQWNSGSLIDVKLTIAKAGTALPSHSHSASMEIAVVRSGKLVFQQNGDKVIIGPGESVVIPKAKSHAGYFPEDTEVYVILIPRAPEYAPESTSG